jgi:ATP-dependent exoDNAse (exonuclease V) beta subunit
MKVIPVARGPFGLTAHHLQAAAERGFSAAITPGPPPRLRGGVVAERPVVVRQEHSTIPLPFDAEPDTVESRIDARDRLGRQRAVDPRYNVALEASAGTGKTRVLVDRYVNLLKAGVDPSNVLAITFTRKAAAEMRERIVGTLRRAADQGEIPPARWRELRDRTADIAISTIDAFCLSLLREFPLEADLDPGFAMADETEVPRLIDEALDRALRVCRQIAREDQNVALVFAQLGDRRARAGLAALLNRRVVAPRVLSEYLAKGPRELDVESASRAAATRLLDVFAGMTGGLDRFLDTGPPDPSFRLLTRALRQLDGRSARLPPSREASADYRSLGGGRQPGQAPATVQSAFARVREHFLTQEGEPRSKLLQPRARFITEVDWRAHRDLVVGHAPAVKEAWLRYKRDLNVLVSRGIMRMFRVAETEYRRTLDAHAVLDFSDVLLRALDLLRQMEEFAQSRYRLESRYHHVLVDELQDTSRAQWELVSLLIQSWGEGIGLPHGGPLPPSIFIVGDRKQSIYGFRDADVSVLQEASRHLEVLRPEGDVRRSISRSFRSVPALLAFVNDVCQDMDKAGGRHDAFTYEEQDRFPIDTPTPEWTDALGAVLADTPDACAEVTAEEIQHLIASATTIRDRDTGVRRAVRPGDIAILFRTRESHRAFEEALERRRIASYVYKGLGFFDADEIKDALALLWYLADPLSNLRSAAFMRSRFVRISDEGLRRLAPRLADALGAAPPLGSEQADAPSACALDAPDAAALAAAREATRRWRGLVDRMPPAELLDRILNESAYAAEMRGPRFQQARENLKKLRALVRRIQNRGYVTLGRIAAHLDRLALGDEANASIDALDAVNLMTVHAAKGLEFPIVFLVNLARGTGNRRDPIRVTADPDGASPSVAVGDYQSDADEDEIRREREETKRLLYVALTRARDRLYLGSVVKDGRLQPGRGSLADVLPASLLAALDGRSQGRRLPSTEGRSQDRPLPSTEGRSQDRPLPSTDIGADLQVGPFVSPFVDWRATSGHVHRVRLCARAELSAVQHTRSHVSPDADCALDFAPLLDASPRRHALATAIIGEPDPYAVLEGSASDRLVGTLVHRLLHRCGVGAGGEAARQRIQQLVRPEEAADADRQVFELALDAYQRVSCREDVRALYTSGEVLHEVPFTMRVEEKWVRGTIDCVIRGPGGEVTVLEFKTGRPRPEHRDQVDLYRRAAEYLFSSDRVNARLVYSNEVHVT